MKAYDNKTALIKSVLKTVIDPSGGLNPYCIENCPQYQHNMKKIALFGGFGGPQMIFSK